VKRLLISAIFALGFAGTANAALLDFTDRTAVPDGAMAGSVAGTTYALSATGGAISYGENQDGSTCPALLACERDGLGITDDEITATSESLLIEFGVDVRITAIHLLDLFIGTGTEQARIEYDGGVILINAAEALGSGLSGYMLLATDIVTGFLRFSGLALSGDDGSNDYALAALEIEPVPAPAALPLLLSGLAGLAFARSRRRRMA
jgi:hypothetical protein